MENILFELSVALVGTLFAIAALGVKYIMNSQKFKKFMDDNELLVEIFKSVVKEFVAKYPNLSDKKSEEVMKAYLKKEVHTYLGYSLNDKQLDQLFEAAKNAYKNR